MPMLSLLSNENQVLRAVDFSAEPISICDGQVP